MNVTTTLPTAVPVINLAMSTVILFLALILLVAVNRRYSGRVRVVVMSMSLQFGLIALAFAAIVLTAGSLSQLGVLPTDIWVLFGTGGRMGVLIFELTLLTVLVGGDADD